MSLPEVDVDLLAGRLLLIRPHLDERAWRLLLGAEAKVLGRGGIKVVAAAVGAHPDTVAQGVRELDYPDGIPGRVRRPGAGRPAAGAADPGLWEALDALVDPVTRGDPESVLRWTTKSTSNLARELAATGHRVSPSAGGKLLKANGYSLQAKVAPYGVYDIAANAGWVNVGTDADTGQFAVESIRRWWNTIGVDAYPTATRLLITADSGGSNGFRLRLWTTELAALATEIGLTITVCHLPPGTSKWNKIEHRLFSAISRSWRARPLTSHEVVIETIRATTTSTGLTVKAELDLGTYEKGIKISDQQMMDVETTQLHRHQFHGDWNYTMHPATRPNAPT